MCLDRTEMDRLLRDDSASQRRSDFRAHQRECGACAVLAGEVAEAVLLERVADAGGHPDSESLSRYLDEDAPPSLALVVELHLQRCPACRERVHGLEQGRAAARQAPILSLSHEPIVAPASRRPAPLWPRQAVGAAITVAVALVLLRGGLRPGGQGPAPLLAQQPPAPATPLTGRPLLQDGPVRLALADGVLQVGGADPAAREIYQALLPGGELRLPDSVRRYVVRGPGSAPAPADPVTPYPDQVLRGGPARFRWAGNGSRRYHLELYAALRKQAPLKALDTTGPSAELAGLPAGQEFTWVVTDEGGQEVVPERGFRVLGSSALAELERIERTYPGAHLLRGTAALRNGLVEEALAEYRKAAAAAGNRGPAERAYQRLKQAVGEGAQ